VARDDGNEENRNKTEESDEGGLDGLHGECLVVGGWRPTAQRARDEPG
jgi:hypothetical protein